MSHPLRQPWQTLVSAICGVLLAFLFIVSGGWKLTDPLGWSARLIQLRFPGDWALAGTLAVGIAEVLAAVLLVVPRFRRWGGWLTAGLLVAFMIYVGANYTALRGEECSCFPWIKRSVGPPFFIVDGIWMLMALLAAWWARPSQGFKTAALVLAVIGVFAGVSYGVQATRQDGIRVPEQVTVNGQPYMLKTGTIWLYFFDPECMHCLAAARQMSGYKWKKPVKQLGVATRVPQYAAQFLADSKLNLDLTTDLDFLRKTFEFGDPPFAVLIEGGRQKEAFIQFDDNQPKARLQQLGYIE
ncbi:MAG: DoxX family protein [Bryobacteraceae bacterium]